MIFGLSILGKGLLLLDLGAVKDEQINDPRISGLDYVVERLNKVVKGQIDIKQINTCRKEV